MPLLQPIKINLQMNIPTKLMLGNTFNSSDSKFTVLLRKVNLLLSEQRINGKMVAYEVASTTITPQRNFQDGKWTATGDLIERYPSAQAFGKGKFDRSFCIAEKESAIKYFNMCRVEEIRKRASTPITLNER